MHRASGNPLQRASGQPPARLQALDRSVAPKGDVGGLLTIHHFAHQSGHHERSEGLSPAQMHDFGARVFFDRSEGLYKGIPDDWDQFQEFT